MYREDRLFFCRFHQAVNVCNVVIVFEEISEFVQCLTLLRGHVFKVGVRDSLEASGNELVAVVLDEFLDSAVRLVSAVDYDVLRNVLILILLLLYEYLRVIVMSQRASWSSSTSIPSWSLILNTHLWSNMKLTLPLVPSVPPHFVK